MTDRSLNYEKRFKTYLFNGGFDRFFDICKNIGILHNINAINYKINEQKDLNNDNKTQTHKVL